MGAMTEGDWRYNQLIKRFPSEAEPAFEDATEQERWWGRAWGCTNDVGRLRAVLMHRPGPEVNIVDTARRLDIGAFGDEQVGWYWRGTEGPDLAAMQAQHDGLAAVLEREGVEVIRLDPPGKDRMKSCYTRDVVVGVGGGAIVMRLGQRIRRGEELPATRTLARIGCPILRTLSGTAIMEGGSFAWIDAATAVLAVSSRGNEEGARQVEEVLRAQGVTLIRVPLAGYRLHIDGVFLMMAPDLALVNPTQLPFWFLQSLRDRGIETIEVHHEDDPWIINGLAIAPRRVLMAEGVSGYTRDRLDLAGVEVIAVPFDKMCSGGGGIHCSTSPLIRDPV